MTEKDVQKLYREMRKAYSSKRYYYKKKYGIELSMPKLVKCPTEKTILRFARQIQKQGEKAKKEAYKAKQGKKETSKIKKSKQNKVPKLEEILINRIKEIVKEGLSSSNRFEQYKAKKIDDLIAENLTDKQPDRNNKLKEWVKALPKLDDAINQFIFDSSQTDQPTKNHSVYLWNYISSTVLGTKQQFNEEYEKE